MHRALAFAALFLWAAIRPGVTATFTDAAGRTVTLPAKVERVFAAGPPASVTLFAVAPEKLVGWVSEPSADQKAFLPSAYAGLPVVGRLTGDSDQASLDRVRGMSPDLIVDVGTVDRRYAAIADRVQAATGVPYILLDGRLERTPALLRELGGLLGVEPRAGQLAAWADRALADNAAARDALPRERWPRAYLGRGGVGLETGGTGFVNLESVEVAGAINVAAALPPGWHKVTLDQVGGWRPDVIVTENATFAQQARTAPDWAAVPAVAAKRVALAPSLPFGWIEGPPGPNRLIGLYWLDGVLHPDRAGQDLRPRVREFYRLFYGVNLTDEQVARLLAT